MREGSNNRNRLVTELYRDTGAAKLPLVTAYIKDLIESDVKFLVFAHHQDVMDGIANVLRTNNVDHIRIDGKTPTPKRQEYAHHVQEDEGCRVALLSITAAGPGLNLTAANLIIFAELFWNPGVNIIKSPSTFVLKFHLSPLFFPHRLLDRLKIGAIG